MTSQTQIISITSQASINMDRQEKLKQSNSKPLAEEDESNFPFILVAPGQPLNKKTISKHHSYQMQERKESSCRFFSIEARGNFPSQKQHILSRDSNFKVHVKAPKPIRVTSNDEKFYRQGGPVCPSPRKVNKFSGFSTNSSQFRNVSKYRTHKPFLKMRRQIPKFESI